ncbi:MAG: hypothetical protein JXQ99_00430 [Hyphomicrobiaceae bacterium]
MRRFALVLVLTFIATVLALPALAQNVQFPKIVTSDLNGRKLSFPKSLPGDRSLVLIAFKREQQADLDVWIEKFGLKKADAPAWIEMPVVANYGSVWRAFLDNAMRSGIVTKEARARVFTVYTRPAEFREKLRFPTDAQVYVLVVSRSGKILARADGKFSDAKAGLLRRALLPGQIKSRRSD